MPTDLFTLSIIGIAILFSVSMGIYSLIRFISAYRRGEDVFRAKGYLITAFILIFVVPFFIILIGTKLTDITKPYPLIEISVTSGSYPSGERIYIPKNIELKKETKNIDLTLNNIFDEEKGFSIVLSCIDEEQKCKKAYNILFVEDKEVKVEPKANIILPISIDIKEGIPSDDYLWKIEVQTSDNATYDYVDVRISVE